MTGVLLTQATTPITGQFAWLLGKLMDGIYTVLSSLFGVENIGVTIILFTIVIYTLLLPLQIKQQKFSKMSAVMNPEIQAINKKYANKKDQASMMKMQEETQLVYQKYGTSPMGGCSTMLIQFPLLLGLWKVIQNIPAYVGGVKAVYMPLAQKIMEVDGYQKIMEEIGTKAPIYINPAKFPYTETNTIIDVLYKLNNQTWGTLADKFPQLESIITSTQSHTERLNSFLGISIAETPQAMFSGAMKEGAVMIALIALAIPLLSGFTQWLSAKLMPQPAGNDDKDNPVASQMKMMNVMMPLMSVFMCFSLQAGLGIYWIASAVVRCVQQVLINRHLAKIPVEDLVAENMKKAQKKLEKKGNQVRNINQMAQKNVRNIEEPKREVKPETVEQKTDSTSETAKNAKPGSLASKANMVKRFNEHN